MQRDLRRQGKTHGRDQSQYRSGRCLRMGGRPGLSAAVYELCLPSRTQHYPLRLESLMVAAIILSAGKSERMGSPKALLQYRGQSFLATILAEVASARMMPAIVVAGHHYDEISQAFPNVQIVFNPNYEQGMSTSVQAGIRALPTELAGALGFLVDHPLSDW